MKSQLWKLLYAMVTLAVLLPSLAACGTPQPVAPTHGPTEPTTISSPAPPAATPVPPTAAPEGPTVGGTLTYALNAEPQTLDAHGTFTEAASEVMSFIGGTLVAKDVNGEYVPYLAESWEISDDGLIWDFTLKKGVKFHNGAPLTAHDWVWTFDRALEQAGLIAPMIASIDSVEALDDYTLRLHLKQPFFPLLNSLAYHALMPLSKAAVEESGEQYGRQPISVGPYMFKEWITGEKIVLERNPDCEWGPPFAHQGPYYIDTIEFLILPEYDTVIAGLEAGEIDYAKIEPLSVQRIKDSGRFQVFDLVKQGMEPQLIMNVSKPPFTDVRVRQAFNLAVDREALLKLVESGYGEVQYGPLSSSMAGYWAGVEESGYRFDLARAKTLMEEAGYTVGDNGMLEKDGQPLRIVMSAPANISSQVKVAEVLQEQYEQLGVEIEMQVLEYATLWDALVAGDFVATIQGYSYPEADIMAIWFHSSYGPNFPKGQDVELDSLLEATRTATDSATRQEALTEVQKHIVEQAYAVPLYAPSIFVAVSNRVEGVNFYPYHNLVWVRFDDAYVAGQ